MKKQEKSSLKPSKFLRAIGSHVFGLMDGPYCATRFYERQLMKIKWRADFGPLDWISDGWEAHNCATCCVHRREIVDNNISYLISFQQSQ